VAWRYEFYFLVVRNNNYSLRSFVKYCFYHSKIKFISSSRRVISSISCMCMHSNSLNIVVFAGKTNPRMLFKFEKNLENRKVEWCRVEGFSSELRLEQLLRFSRALQTSRVHPLLDVRTLKHEPIVKSHAFIMLNLTMFKVLNWRKCWIRLARTLGLSLSMIHMIHMIAQVNVTRA